MGGFIFMKKTNKQIAKILEKYYKDAAVIRVFEKNISFLKERNNPETEDKIKRLTEKINEIKSKNMILTIAISELSQEEKDILKYKFQLKYSISEITDKLHLRDTTLWKRQCDIYSFLNKCLDH